MNEGNKWDLGRRTEKISTREHNVPRNESVPPASFRRMGMWLLLASLGMLFGASLVGFLVLRTRAEQWPPPGTPPLPGGLWVSTALLIVLSFVLVLAERGARAGRPPVLNRMLGVSVLLAVAFLVAQISNWMRMAILHAAHVVFGLVPLVLVTVRARAGRYTAGDHESIHLVGMYWHFLLVTWVAIMLVMRI
jgi:cytochrome c oxidase subunit 3